MRRALNLVVLVLAVGAFFIPPPFRDDAGRRFAGDGDCFARAAELLDF
jgi:hypothetical protein